MILFIFDKGKLTETKCLIKETKRCQQWQYINPNVVKYYPKYHLAKNDSISFSIYYFQDTVYQFNYHISIAS